MGAEKKLEKKCTDHAQKRGWLAYKLSYVGRRGAPDKLFISPQGAVLFIEFKTPTGPVSDLQQIALDKLHTRKVHCAVCRTFEGFKSVLDKIEGRT